MNYRQWKKRFKKQNGRNPNCLEDKRERMKKVARSLKVSKKAIRALEKNMKMFRFYLQKAEAAINNFMAAVRTTTEGEDHVEN